MPLGAASGSPVAHGNYMTNPYATPSVFARPAQQLHIVSFKCARADVYYIPEGTGLEVKAGDMVIVDGDRGMDLGTVTHANVSVPEAKRLKDEAAKKHFEWLMMFSRTAQVTKSTTDGMLAASGASAVGGMRPPSSHQGASLHNENEIRPKMIKRLAQNHEIQMLRDKEGSEAKAKRVCSAKVVEHSLNMEILDAEFQLYVLLDWSRIVDSNFRTETGRSLHSFTTLSHISTSTTLSRIFSRSTRLASGCRLSIPLRSPLARRSHHMCKAACLRANRASTSQLGCRDRVFTCQRAPTKTARP